MQAANICLDYSPVHGGIYRSVGDFSRALPAPVVSFCTTGEIAGHPVATDDATMIACGNGIGSRSCLFVSRHATQLAAAAVEKADLLVVHSLFRGHATWAQKHARHHGIPYWAVPHGCLDPWGLKNKFIAKRLWLTAVGQRYLEAAQHVVFATTREREKAGRWAPAKRSVVVNWPVTLPAHVDHSASRTRLRTRLGISEQSLVLLYMGRLHSMKRLPETIQCFCTAHRAPWHLVIAGMDGDITRQQLAEQIPPDFRNWIHLIGAVNGNEWTDAYAGSDAFVSLSHRENFGYASAEAAAFGLPLLLSDGHDLAYEMPFSSNRTFAGGWLVAGSNPSYWPQALTDLFSANESDRARRGDICGRWAADTLSFTRFQETLHRLAHTERTSHEK